MSDAAVSALILGLTLVLFVSERLRHDLVALLALFATVAFGLVEPRQALSGFSDQAVIVVAAVLVLGRALELSGLPEALTRRVIPTRAGFAVQLALLMAMGALLSGFMNNIAALVITMPLATAIARQANASPGAALMPLAFATILGGMTTLIGTPANLILSSVREEHLGAPFGFFAMTQVGAAVTAVGLVYLCSVGWRLLPARRSRERASRPWRVFELVWPGPSGSLAPLAALRQARARLLARFRDGSALAPAEPLREGDRLLLVSRNNQWDVAVRTGLAALPGMEPDPQSVTTRVVVAHGSPFIGQGYEAVRTHAAGEVSVIAGGPRPARLRQPLDTILLEPGDQLYLSGAPEAIAALLARGRLLEIDRFDPHPVKPGRAAAAGTIFALAVAAVVTGAASPAIAFFAAAVAAAALRLIPAGEVYRSVDWPIVVLLAAMIPVGRSFETSGAASIAATWLGEGLAGTPPFGVLAAICAGTLLLSIFLNNVATAILMGPIAIQLSGLVGLTADQALLAVLVGASSDFLTPIGHHNNLLVMGPGGYRFTDYARMGAPLAVMTVATAAAVLALSG
jgi:di/tricarboxylate transporter